jgi:hypothetical protein
MLRPLKCIGGWALQGFSCMLRGVFRAVKHGADVVVDVMYTVLH